MTYISHSEVKNEKRARRIEVRASREGFRFTLFGGAPATILRLDSKNALKLAEMAMKHFNINDGLLSMLYELKVHAGNETFSLILTGYFIPCADLVNILRTHVHFDAIGRTLMGAVYRNHCIKKDENTSQVLLKALELAVPPATAALLAPTPQRDTNLTNEVKR